MGKKNKIKKLKFKNKKAPSSNSGNQKIEENCNKESAPEGEESPKNEITEEIRHKKKESRKKMKKLRKKNKKKKKINLDYEGLYDFEEFFMNQEDIEKLPHDTFTTFKDPTNIESNINNTIIVSTKEAKVIPLLFFIFLPLFLTLSFKHFF